MRSKNKNIEQLTDGVKSYVCMQPLSGGVKRIRMRADSQANLSVRTFFCPGLLRPYACPTAGPTALGKEAYVGAWTRFTVALYLIFAPSIL